LSDAIPLLEINGLTKVFKRRFGRGTGAELRAVDGISLKVERGDIFGFLGPNGAGKSTTIRMALGLIHPTSGRVSIAGYDVATQKLSALRRVGAFVESPSFYTYLSGWKNLEIFAGLSGGVTKDEISAAIAKVGLSGREHDQVRVYSHGMRQRLGLASCLLPRPELLVLDEPSDGLDPHGIRDMRELVVKLAREDGLTVFLSSHLLGEVERLCNRIAIVERGKIAVQGELPELEARYRRWCIETDAPASAEALLKTQFKLEDIRREADSRRLFVNLGAARPADVNAALVNAGLAVRCFGPEEGWLDRLFLDLTSSKESPASLAGKGSA